MKVLIITRHAIINYGSLLQAMATQQLLKSIGWDCEIIDYIRSDENYHNQEKTLLKGKSLFSNNLLKRVAYLVLRQPESAMAGKRFAKMRKKYLNTTKLYSDIEQLQKNKPVADIYDG